MFKQTFMQYIHIANYKRTIVSPFQHKIHSIKRTGLEKEKRFKT